MKLILKVFNCFVGNKDGSWAGRQFLEARVCIEEMEESRLTGVGKLNKKGGINL